MMKLIVSIFILSILFFGCKKEEPFSTIPKIELRAIAPGNIVAFQDSISIEIYYEDGDGNLGENNPDVKNLFIKDSRSNITYEYRISQLAPSDDSRAIKGTFEVVIPYTTMVTQDSVESLYYTISVNDRSGNKSN